MSVKMFSYGLASLALIAGAFQARSAEGDATKSHNRYVAQLADCVACHTYPGNPEYTGGIPFKSALGTVYSANITPDKKTGIGNYSYQDFDNAVRKGINIKGKPVDPGMPYPAYSKMTDQDLKALYDFFMHEVKPVVNEVKGAEGQSEERLKAWREKYSPTVEVWRAPQGMDPVIARGAYLVETLGHCGYCHTERGADGQEVAYSNDKERRYLAGAVYDNWLAINLRNDNKDGLGDWSEEEIVTLLKSGRNYRTAVFGGMATVVGHSTQYMTKEDLTAVARYLKSLEPKTQSPAYKYDDATAKAIAGGDISKAGAAVYVDNCNACHRSDGKGYAGAFPALAGNSVVRSDNPISLIHIVLAGFTVPATEAAPSTFTMPAFGDRLDDQSVADVVNFIRSGWGNGGKEDVTPETVAKVRESTKG
jgi:mono/diheme cytochrome c family protein